MTMVSVSLLQLHMRPKTILNISVVFSKSRCPYCSDAKGTLRSLDAEFQVLELDQMSMLLKCRAWQDADM